MNWSIDIDEPLNAAISLVFWSVWPDTVVRSVSIFVSLVSVRPVYVVKSLNDVTPVTLSWVPSHSRKSPATERPSKMIVVPDTIIPTPPLYSIGFESKVQLISVVPTVIGSGVTTIHDDAAWVLPVTTVVNAPDVTSPAGLPSKSLERVNVFDPEL